jgi:protein TonB
VQACEVIRSSGSASLDKAACDNVSRRARFDAATDESGAKVVGTYASSVKWQIPR